MGVTTVVRASRRMRRPSLAALALTALGGTVVLVAMGSIVRVTGHGLGCPDWPLCYGRVVPPALTGAWVEFTHRLLGGVASALIVGLGVSAWRAHRSRPAITRAVAVLLALLAVQVGLGGLHVITEIPPTTGWIHTAVAMLIVGLLAFLAARTAVHDGLDVQRAGGRPASGQEGAGLPQADAADRPALVRRGDEAGLHRLRAWLALTVAATYGLLLTGSYVTRSGASLVCPDFPLCGAPARYWLTDVQMLHRFAALAAAVLMTVAVIWIVRAGDVRLRRLRPLALTVAGLLVIQVGLGVANVLLKLPMWSRVLHLTVGALLFAALVALWTCCSGDAAEDRLTEIEEGPSI